MSHPLSFARALGLGLALAGGVSATAARAAERKVFVGCPILRNTALPCWMGKDGDQLYYLGPQGDLQAEFYPPQFQHRMLVEGEVADTPKICGGVVLKNVTASVLPEVDESCNVTLPAEGYPDPPAHRGPGPSGVRGGKEPEERPRRPVAETLKPPFAPTDFVATFDADSDRKWRSASQEISAAARFAQASNAARVEVSGYRAAIRLSNGRDFVENEAIAEARARTAEEALRVLGLPATTKLTVNWTRKLTPSTGTSADAAARKVVIRVTPGTPPN